MGLRDCSTDFASIQRWNKSGSKFCGFSAIYCFSLIYFGKWWPRPDSNRGPNDYENETPSAIRLHSGRNVTSCCYVKVSKCSRPKRKPKNCLSLMLCSPCSARPRTNQAPKSDRSSVRKPLTATNFVLPKPPQGRVRCSKWELAVLA